MTSPLTHLGTLDRFKRATIQTVRALSGRDDVEVGFSDNPAAEVAGNRLKVPLPSPDMPAHKLAALRGEADLGALRLRLHNPATHVAARPTAPEAAALFDALETARVVAVGSDGFEGVAQNIDAGFEHQCKGVRTSSPAALPLALRAKVQEALSGRAMVPSATSLWDAVQDKLAGKISLPLEQLITHKNEQEAYARAVLDLIRTLEDEQPTEEESESAPPDENDAEDPDLPPEDSQEPEPQEPEPDLAQGQAPPDGSEPPLEDALETLLAELEDDGNADDDTDDTAEEALPSAPAAASRPELNNLPGYSIYTKAFDEIVPAAELADPDELTHLRAMLDRKLGPLQSTISKLATRLQRRLMALQRRSWDFDQEEGWLDSARLARIITNPTLPLSYKVERQTDFRDTVVSLLIDNSGSMRGRPIAIAALSADILARTLERCGVRVEVLGFTTRGWKGGKARDKWVADGRPLNPGRLNDIRHIIYKSADSPWRRAHKNLGLMLREGLLKENIDGEALIWAHDRLMARPEQRRILMIISDGAPVDDATLASNNGAYLEHHLRAVIGWIERYSPVQLMAIGIGHDVTRYYKRAVTISDAEQLGGTMVGQLADLFEEAPRLTRKG